MDNTNDPELVRTLIVRTKFRIKSSRRVVLSLAFRANVLLARPAERKLLARYPWGPPPAEAIPQGFYLTLL